MKKQFFYICLTAFFLDVFLSPVRGYLGIDYCSVLGFISYLFLSIFCLKKYNEVLTDWHIIIALTIGQWFINLPILIIDFKETLWSFPDLLFHTLGVICGFFYYRLRNPFKLIIIALCCSIVISMFFWGYDYWLHKLNFGTFTGKVKEYDLPTKFEVFDENKSLITEKDFSNKIVLLDFWHTRCGVCFKKFPQVQAVYDKYKNDLSVMVLAINKPLEEDKPGEAFQVIKEKGYTFPVLIAKDEEFPEQFGVTSYPTTFVINQDGQIVYKGDIEGAVRMVSELK